MSAEVISNPPTSAATESKSARKKKAKAEAAATTAVPQVQGRSETPSQDAKTNGVDGGSESAYIKDLQKYVKST